MSSGERRLTALLARTFFSRMFESDLMPPGLPQVRLIVGVVAFLAAPSLLLPLLLLKKYFWIFEPNLLRMAMAQDRTMALLLSMTATAFITLVIWENIFPDRRDSRTLGVLPICNRSFVFARLAAIVVLFALLFLGTSFLASLAFGIVGSVKNLPEGFLGVSAAHFASVSAANAFVFFGVVALQCLLLNVTGPTAAHRLAVVLQILMIVTVLQMPMVLPPGGSYALDANGIPGWATTISASLLPPLWFLSLHESLVGRAYAGTGSLAGLAALLGIATPLLALGFYAASYRRMTRLAIEGRPVPRRQRRSPISVLISGGTRLLTQAPAAAAVCAFTLRSLSRSRQHRMLLAVWIGVALALTISAALPLVVRAGWSAFDRPRDVLLAGPLIFTALIQTGMRSLFAIPVEIKANWSIRLREPMRLGDALGGASAALILAGVLPPALIALVSAAALWGLGAGVQHAAFCAALGIGLSQILMRGVDRVPFTCIYTPGTAKIDKFWPAYLTAFSTFTYGMASAEAALLTDPRALAQVTALIAIAAGLLWWLRVRATRQLVQLRFEAEPEGVLSVIG